MPKIKKVITDNPPYTTILFEDGTKQAVKTKNEELKYKYVSESGVVEEYTIKNYYNRDKGIMIALLERIYGKKEFYKIMGLGKMIIFAGIGITVCFLIGFLIVIGIIKIGFETIIRIYELFRNREWEEWWQ